MTEITADRLSTLLDAMPKGVRVLSLDCFDTIVWRKVAKPTDVFFALQDSALWQAHGITAPLRAKAEDAARRRKRLLVRSSEVTIVEIYRELLPSLSEPERAEWVALELEAEKRHGFVFEPTLALIRAAHRRGLRVIVVSDTYFSHVQLRELLAALMGDEHRLIAQVHCSSECGGSKVNGMFKVVLQREKLKPAQVWHLGDNPKADLWAPQQLGMTGVHLRHHMPAVTAQLEQRERAALQLMPEIHRSAPMPSSFHAQLATRHGLMAGDVRDRIGYGTLGPVMHAFTTWVRDRVAALAADGTPVKAAFLLRDGHLPARAMQALTGEAWPLLRISRFTANAACLRARDDVVNLLAGMLSEKSMPALARQLLLPPALAESILAECQTASRPDEAFARRVLREDTLRTIFEASAAFRARLWTHVQRATGVQRGDTLVFVDLGYSGTVQTRLREIFQDEYGVRLHGLYLIASRALPDQVDRDGLIGPDWADERLVVAMTAYIGLFEMMCTMAEPSTVDYTDDGAPVYGASGAKATQSAAVERMQDACLRFVHDVAAVPARCKPATDRLELARQVVADLGRLIYLPDAQETECLSAFEFDFNLGTDLMLATADLETGLEEFRREGFALMNRDFTQLRISYPMELRHMDISLAITLMSLQRYGYGLSTSDASLRRETVPALVANAIDHSLGVVEAHATHDGFFSASLPMSSSFDMSLLLGHRYQWLQIESVSKVSMADSRETFPLEIGKDVLFDGVDAQPGGLLQCSPSAMLFLPACAPKDHGRFLVRVVYRPLVRVDATADHPPAEDAATRAEPLAA